MSETTESPGAAAPLPVLGVVHAAWTPPELPADAPPGTPLPVSDHPGHRIPYNSIFFAAPPPEIGPVLSAHSTVREEESLNPASKRMTGALGGAFLGVLVCIIILYKFTPWTFDSMPPLSFLIPCVVIGGALGYFKSKPKHAVTYVGERGVARIGFGGKSEADRKHESFTFDAAEELRVQETRRFVNGAYSGTTYAYEWRDSTGRSVFKIAGEHKSKEGTPGPDDQYHWAQASERRWSNYKLAQFVEKLQDGQPVRFSLGGADHILVSPGGIELHLKGKVTQMPLGDIGSVTVHNGEVTVARVGGKAGVLGIGRDGVFSFPYASLGNGRLFLYLMERLQQPERSE